MSVYVFYDLTNPMQLKYKPFNTLSNQKLNSVSVSVAFECKWIRCHAVQNKMENDTNPSAETLMTEAVEGSVRKTHSNTHFSPWDDNRDWRIEDKLWPQSKMMCLLLFTWTPRVLWCGDG